MIRIGFVYLATVLDFLENVTFGSVVFTVISGAFLTAGLFAIAKFAPAKWVNFSLAFLAVQCLLNAFFSLKTLFVISAATDASSDAANMAAATGVPALIWVVLWIGISLVMITVGMRLYAVGKGKKSADTLFED